MNSGFFQYKIATFYKFLNLEAKDLHVLRDEIRAKMQQRNIVGTVIIAVEGVNSTLCGNEVEIDRFVSELSEMLSSYISPKYSYSGNPPFQKVDVKVKPE